MSSASHKQSENIPDANAEWLETDGLGGFASGCVGLYRTRRYHALLLSATRPPSGRMVLVNGYEAWLETPKGSFALSTQHYAPNVEHPNGRQRIVKFSAQPWPAWTFQFENAARIEHELFIARSESGAPCTALAWKLAAPFENAVLCVRLLLSGRDYHALHHENGAFCFDAQVTGADGDNCVSWRPYTGVPGITARLNGTYSHQPEWFRNFSYSKEQTRGLDFQEGPRVTRHFSL